MKLCIAVSGDGVGKGFEKIKCEIIPETVWIKNTIKIVFWVSVHA